MARPRVPLLSKPIIRDTALKLVDEHGLTDFSMRKLATVLGVQAPSLYSHYANKDELLDDVANVIMESVDVSGFDSDDWRGALRTWRGPTTPPWASIPISFPTWPTVRASGPSPSIARTPSMADWCAPDGHSARQH